MLRRSRRNANREDAPHPSPYTPELAAAAPTVAAMRPRRDAGRPPAAPEALPLTDGKGVARMSHSPAAPGVAALALLLAAGPGARADWIAWSYNWSRSPAEVLADNPATGGKITLTDESQHTVIGDSDVVAANLQPQRPA